MPASSTPIGFNRPRNATMIAVKPYPGRDVGLELTDGPRRLADPREPREGTGNPEAEPHRARPREAAEAAGPGGVAAHPDLEALERARHQHEQHHHRDDREDRAEVHPSCAQGRQELPVLEGDRLREVVSVGVPPRPPHQPVEEVLRDVHQHQAGQDLVGSEPVAEQRRDPGPRHAAEHAQHQHERKREHTATMSGASTGTAPPAIAPAVN